MKKMTHWVLYKRFQDQDVKKKENFDLPHAARIYNNKLDTQPKKKYGEKMNTENGFFMMNFRWKWKNKATPPSSTSSDTKWSRPFRRAFRLVAVAVAGQGLLHWDRVFLEAAHLLHLRSFHPFSCIQKGLNGQKCILPNQNGLYFIYLRIATAAVNDSCQNEKIAQDEASNNWAGNDEI